MQVELKELQRDVGITFVFVTHDQEEALTMSDRIAVFNEGRIEQVGTRARSTSSRRLPFVAGFVGTSNVIDGEAARRAARGRRAPTASARRRSHLHIDARGHPAVHTVTATAWCARWSTPALPTRYIVDLDGGGSLIVVRQNLQTSSEWTSLRRGRTRQLSWQREHAVQSRSG